MNSLLKRLSFGKLAMMLVVSALLGSLLTWLVVVYTQKPPVFKALRENDPTKPLIRPLLGYSTPETKTNDPLKETLTSIVGTYTSKGDASAISVYYRDLNNGHWFGINQDETFIPASLFKVPLMITYLKDAESNPRLLSTEIFDNLTEDQNIHETIKPGRSIVQGDSYTIEELLRYMIEYSDNNATVLLFNHINQDTLRDVFSDLNIQLPSEGINTDFMSVSNYSFFFRVLYNATYLSHDMSEKGLELLSKIDFDEGMRKDIPQDVTVADKFGEYFLIQNGVPGQYQLHDCGIVYHPKHPYILCVMTKGASLDALKKAIQNISSATYKHIDALE